MKIMFDISCESSARQTIDMKCQALFSLKRIVIKHRMSSVLFSLKKKKQKKKKQKKKKVIINRMSSATSLSSLSVLRVNVGSASPNGP